MQSVAIPVCWYLTGLRPTAINVYAAERVWIAAGDRHLVFRLFWRGTRVLSGACAERGGGDFNSVVS